MKTLRAHGFNQDAAEYVRLNALPVYRPSALRENGDSRARDPGQHAGDTVLRQHRLQAGSLRSRPGHSAREASVSAPAHLPEREEEGERGDCELATVSSATQARVCPKQNCWSAFTGWGTTSTRAKVALGWRGASWAKLSLLTSATTSCFDPKEGQTCGSSSTSPP